MWNIRSHAEASVRRPLGCEWNHSTTSSVAPYFESAFSKLSFVVVWVHNLLVKFWDGDSLETISTSLGRLLKIDEFTFSLSRSKFARICMEINLAKPLKQGFWIGDDKHWVFVVVLYKKNSLHSAISVEWSAMGRIPATAGTQTIWEAPIQPLALIPMVDKGRRWGQLGLLRQLAWMHVTTTSL